MPSLLFDRIRVAWRELDHGQQISLSILAPCAALILVLAGFSLRASVLMPFRASKSVLYRSDQLIANQRALAAQQEQISAGKDTDGDGMSDLDESNTFHTSPYLTDTDSDGVLDGEEVRVGTDPNCPPNKDCYGFAALNPDVVPGNTSTTAPSVSGSAPAIEAPQAPESLTSTQIREYLLRNALATAGQLDALPDAAVVELYRRAYTDLVGAGQTPPISATSSTSSQPSTP